MQQKIFEQTEQGVEIPLDRIDPAILQRMIEEFVTRQWEGADDSDGTLEQKVCQVLHQLHAGTARVVFDAATESWNIVAAK